MRRRVVLLAVMILALCGLAPVCTQETPPAAAAGKARNPLADSWDRTFRQREFRAVEPSESFAAYCVDRLMREGRLKRGDEVLVLAMGDGRNAIHFAERGLAVTGLDISPVAIDKARGEAVARGVKIETVEADLFEYDLGAERWDLVTNIYFNPAIEVFDRLMRSVRRGGLILVEGYGAEHKGTGPPEQTRYKANQLLQELSGWRILDYQDGVFRSYWAEDRAVPVVRVLAQKPPQSNNASTDR